MTDPDTLAACTLDVAETGQASFAEAALDTQAIAVTTLPAPGPTTSSSLGSSREATLSVTTPNGVDSLTLSGIAGQRVYTQVESTTVPSQCGELNLVDASSQTLGIGCITNGVGEIDGVLLPDTGAYRIEFRPANGTTGTARIRVITSVDNHGTFAGGPDSSVIALISVPGQIGHYTFAGTAGQRILIEGTASTLMTNCGIPVLRDPSGSTIASGCLEAEDPVALDGTLLSVTGTYTVDVDPPDTETGQVTLRLIESTDQHGTISVGGAPVTATITSAGQVAQFSFTGHAGQKVTVHASSSTIKGGCGELLLRDPNGTDIGLGCLNDDGTGSVDTTTLASDGTYVVEVNPNSINTGSVTVSIS